jgi:hypothetical protein
MIGPSIHHSETPDNYRADKDSSGECIRTHLEAAGIVVGNSQPTRSRY